MEGMLSPSDKQSMVSSFLEIAVGQTADTATQFLQATSWKLEEALQLFYVGNEAGAIAAAAAQPVIADNPAGPATRVDPQSGELTNENVGQGKFDGDEVRPPLPVIREALYDDALITSRIGYPPHESSSVVAFRNFSEEMKQPATWESEQGSTSTAENSRDNLASLYRPPFHLMFHGSFDKAKGAAAAQDKWLLVNLQSTREFSSHMLNRDTWAHEAVSQTITTNFIFWQVYDDTSEGRKVCTYYRLDSIPVVLVIDPITGQKMRSWCGMIQPESLLEDLLQFMDNGPKQHHASLSHKRPRQSSLTPPPKTKVAVDEPKQEDEELLAAAIAASMEGMKHTSEDTPQEKEVTPESSAKKEEASSPKKPMYPPLPEEPKGDRNLLCRVGVRLPDGRRVQRTFLRADPIQLLWSFCASLLDEGETRLFRLTHAIPGASKSLDYESKLTFEESGLANSMISVTWE